MTRSLKILQQYFGYPRFRGPQQQIIEHLSQGNNALVLMPTGGGKSLCYQIPALMSNGTTVVISPLIALMHDQVAALKTRGIRAEYLTGAQSPEEFERVVQELKQQRLKLLYLSPERLVQTRTLDWLDSLNNHGQLSLFAIDEAHCISEWGYDFRQEYRSLSILKARYPKVPRVALTASADLHSREDIARELGLEKDHWFVSSFDRANLHYAIKPGPVAPRQIRYFLNRHAGESGIFYCRSRKATETLANWLNHQGYAALPYHAGLSTEERQQHQEVFVQSTGIIMAATIAFGMGIDKPDVRYVVHLNCPRSIEAYYQETGRAGRDGLNAEALMLLGTEEYQQLMNLNQQPDDRENRERSRLREMAGLCLTHGCRRNYLLSHFGEQSPTTCQGCDHCQPHYAQWIGPISRKCAMTFADDKTSSKRQRE